MRSPSQGTTPPQHQRKGGHPKQITRDIIYTTIYSFVLRFVFKQSLTLLLLRRRVVFRLACSLGQVSLNDSDETGSLIDEDDESSEDQASRSYSDSNDENF